MFQKETLGVPGEKAIKVKQPMLSNSSYQITNVTFEDINDVYKLLVGNRPFVGLNSRYTYFLLARDFSETCLIAKKEREIVAFSSGYIPPRRPDTFFNWEIVVDEKHRGNGLQKELLLHQIKLTNAKFLELTINPSNYACKRSVLDLTQMLHTRCSERLLFSEHDFGDNGHESEVLYRVGPISKYAVASLI